MNTKENAHNALLDELGMTPAPAEGTEAGPASSNTALSLPSTVSASKRVIAEAIDVASLVISGSDREKARDHFRRRLMHNPDGSVMVLNILFAGERIFNRNGDLLDVIPNAVVRLEGVEGDVQLKVLIDEDTTNLLTVRDGQPVSNGSFACIIFKPKSGRGDKKKGQGGDKMPVYKALPLGFVSEALLGTWNRVAKTLISKNWPVIQHIPNTLRRPGVRTVTIKVAAVSSRTYGNGTVYSVGHRRGKLQRLSQRSQFPSPDRIESETWIYTGETEHVFRVSPGEGSDELFWLGRAGDVPIDDRVPVMDALSAVNPFDVLGVTPLTADLDTLRRARQLMRLPRDMSNPLYRSAVDMGMVVPGDPDQSVIAILESYALEAATDMLQQLETSFAHAMEGIKRLNGLPTAEEILNGKSVRVTKRRPHKDGDAAVALMARAFVGEFVFNDSSPMHKRVRAAVIDFCLERDPDYSPEPPKGDDGEKKAKPSNAGDGDNAYPGPKTPDVSSDPPNGGEEAKATASDDSIPADKEPEKKRVRGKKTADKSGDNSAAQAATA